MKRRYGSALRRNLGFAASLLSVCIGVALVTAIASGQLETLVRRASLALTALDNPAQLTNEQKLELRKMIKNKDEAIKYYEGLSPEQKEQAKKQYESLSDDEKKKYRELLGR